jgi:tetratricopeptide (TPR) repeat protein
MTNTNPERKQILIQLSILLPFLAAVVLGIAPHSKSLHSILSTLQIANRENNTAEVINLAQDVVSIEPWRGELWESIGNHAVVANDLETAIRAYREAEQIGVLSYRGFINLGDAYARTGKHNSALAVWQSLIETDIKTMGEDQRSSVLRKIVSFQREIGDYQAAIDTLQAWLAINPDQTEAIYELGLLTAVVQPEEALPILARTETSDKNYSYRIQILRRAITTALFETHPSYQHVIIGRALGNLNQWDLAYYSFEQATILTPGYAEAWAFFGESLQHLGGSGYTELQRAENLNPDSILVQALIALYYRRQGKPEAALEYLMTVSDEEPDQAIWKVEIGNTLAEMGDIITAADYFQQAIDLEPGNPIYWRLQAKFSVTYSQDVREIGLPAAREALLIAPDDPASLDTMGLVLFKLGDLYTAERFLQQALEIDLTYAEAHLHLGQLLLEQAMLGQSNHLEPAIHHLNQAVIFSANNDDVNLFARRILEQYED